MSKEKVLKEVKGRNCICRCCSRGIQKGDMALKGMHKSSYIFICGECIIKAYYEIVEGYDKAIESDEIYGTGKTED